MKNVLLFIVCFINCAVNAQQWDWAKSAIASTNGVSVCADASGNVFVTGGFMNPTITFGSTILTNAGGGYGYADDIFIAKYDANGNVLWAKRAGSTGNDESYSICADANGNVYVTGWFQSATITFGTTTLTNAASCNIFIAKYDANGNVLWAKSAEGTDFDKAFSISADANGNVFITGFLYSATTTFGSTVLTGFGGGGDAFIAKYDANGNVLWAKIMGGTNQDYGMSVSTDAAGNVFMTGTFYSSSITFGSTTLINAGGSCPYGCGDFFIAKYDTNGNVLWAKNAGGINDGEIGTALSADASGNVFVTGSFGASITFGSTTLTGGGLFISKYDANGNSLWTKSASASGNAVSTDAAGNVFLIGTFNSPTITFDSGTISEPAGSLDEMYIVKFDANGNILCTSALASGGNYLRSVSVDPFGNAYIGSVFQVNPFIVGSDTLTRIGYQDVFVAKYKCNNSVSVSVNELSDEEGVSIYPNPSSGIFTVNLRKGRDSNICIYDVLGNCLCNKNCRNETSPKIDLSSQPKGIYFMEIVSEGARSVNKIVLQ